MAKVYFIGAGPGAADLISVRAARILRRVPVCLYAGSIIDERTVRAWTSPSCVLINTASLALEQIIAAIVQHHGEGREIARLHSGDISFFSAVREQRFELARRGVATLLVPGIPAFAAAAAAADVCLTAPGIAQAVVLARGGRAATPVPTAQELANLAASGATLAVHLVARNLPEIVSDTIAHYGGECPCVLVRKASTDDELVVYSTLARLISDVAGMNIATSILLIGPSLQKSSDFAVSARRVGHDEPTQPAISPPQGSFLYSQERANARKRGVE